MRKEIDQQELRKIQTGLLTVLDEYCKTHNLRYFIAYGTLIGAVRHKGYIPWDDDIDVVMLRKDYNKLIAAFNTDMSEKPVRVCHHSIDPSYYAPTAKLIDTRTVLREHLDIDTEIGVYIDILPLDNLGNDYEAAEKRLLKAWHLNEQYLLKTISVNRERNWVKNAVLLAGKALLAFKSLSGMLDKMETFSTALGTDEETAYVSLLEGIAEWEKNNVFKKEWFRDSTPLMFEGIEFAAPIDYHEMLQKCYGDYMQLPPREQQIAHHSFEAWYKE